MFVYHVSCEQVERTGGKVHMFDGLAQTRVMIDSERRYREIKQLISDREFQGQTIMLKSLSFLHEVCDPEQEPAQ